MKRVGGTREIIDVVAGATCLQGTYHHTPEGSGSAGAHDSDRIGVVFLNSLVIPRSGRGDTAVYWADSFAKLGYPCFRIDLPGLGDSAGDLPPEVLEFVFGVNAGRYGPLVSSAVNTLVHRFGLSGVVVVGHCAGAVSALFAAAADCNAPNRARLPAAAVEHLP